MAVLIGMSENFKGQTIPLDRDQISLGRRPENTVAVTDSGVSGQHCAIVREGQRFLLKDLGSTNGTRLNGKSITEAYLKPKDLVQLGATEFIVDGDDIEVVDDGSNMEVDANVEVSSGPIVAPESFDSVSPFGARHSQNSQLWLWIALGLGSVTGLLAVFVLYRILTA